MMGVEVPEPDIAAGSVKVTFLADEDEDWDEEGSSFGAWLVVNDFLDWNVGKG